MQIPFFKYQGTGNDFVVIDNREGSFSQLSRETVAALCHRRFGIGADGLMLLNRHAEYDFEMIYFNADGGESSMCGNGGRCLTQFAWDLGLQLPRYRFLAIDGAHEAYIPEPGTVALKMKDVKKIEEAGDHFILDTGSPHYVTACGALDSLDVFSEGRAIRNSEPFAREGINVNFVERRDIRSIKVRTYERGVEDETLSCGTGVTAAALAFGPITEGSHEVAIETPGGHLKVAYQRSAEGFSDIWLIGPARRVFEGTISITSIIR
jgi:diaminopimelate epimerase